MTAARLRAIKMFLTKSFWMIGLLLYFTYNGEPDLWSLAVKRGLAMSWCQKLCSLLCHVNKHTLASITQLPIRTAEATVPFTIICIMHRIWKSLHYDWVCNPQPPWSWLADLHWRKQFNWLPSCVASNEAAHSYKTNPRRCAFIRGEMALPWQLQ